MTTHSQTSEKSIERYLVDRVKSMGGVALKYTNPNARGYPDRLLQLPGGKTAWVELKSTGKKLAPLQEERFKELWDLGFMVAVCDTREAVDNVLKALAS